MILQWSWGECNMSRLLTPYDVSMTSWERHHYVTISVSPERLTDDDHWRQMSSQAPLLISKGGTTESTMTDHHGHFRSYTELIPYLCDLPLFMWLTKEDLCSLEAYLCDCSRKAFLPWKWIPVQLRRKAKIAKHSQNNQTSNLAHNLSTDSLLIHLLFYFYLVVPCT